VGYGHQILKVAPEFTSRTFALYAGIGIDYLVPNSPILLGLQTGYNYTSPVDAVTTSQETLGRHGAFAQVNVAFHLWTN
jgi:hypothetical protein